MDGLRKSRMGVISAIALFGLWVPGVVKSDESERLALVNGAKNIAAAVVRIDRVAAQNLGGDILEGAPTSGLVIDPEGYVVTSRLSIAGNPSGLLVTTPKGQRFGGTVVAEDFGRDIALLKLEGAKELEAAPLEGIGTQQQGAAVIAVGCAIESETPLMSFGIVSGSGRMWGKAIQSDARVSLAQYGGPLLDIEGKVIGILVPAAGTEMAGELGTDWYDSGVAMAIPSKDIAARLERLKAGKSIKPGLLGISWSTLFVPGTTVPRVAPGSPAARAGLRRGDEFVTMAGKPVERMDQVRQSLGAFDAGDTIEFQVRRNAQLLDLKAELAAELPPFKALEVGVWLERRDDALSIIGIVPKSSAENAGLKVNDVLKSVNGTPLDSTEDLASQVSLLAEGESISLGLGDERSVKVTPKPITGKLPTEIPPAANSEPVWEWSEFALPELPNKAKLWSPPEGQGNSPRGLLVIAADLNQKELDKSIDAWSDAARVESMLVLVVSSRDPERWNVDEAEVLARAARQVSRRWNIDSRRVSVTGLGPGASLAVVAAFTQTETFRGVVCVKGLQFPRLRMKPDSSIETLQILWLGGNEEPRWLQAIQKAGYAVRKGDELDPVSRDGGAAILRWNRLLGAL